MTPTHNLNNKPQRLNIKWTENDFIFFVGRKPEDDDLDRCNCDKHGDVMHLNCGICVHMLPVFCCSTCFPLSCHQEL